LDVLQFFYPKTIFVFAGDIFQSIQKEPRESILWYFMNIHTGDDTFKYSMHITPRVNSAILNSLKKSLKIYYPECVDTIESWKSQNIISNASCTTNCIAPVLDLIHKKFGVLKSVMNTIHATTNTEAVVDSPPPGGGNDLRRGRSSAHNMVPTTTGAAIAATKAIPDLEGKFDGTAVRVPIIVGSISDIVMVLSRKVTVEEVNQAFRDAINDPHYKNYLGIFL
jgi:glyceraldehyde-3-phosphate dehydrogenase type I